MIDRINFQQIKKTNYPFVVKVATQDDVELFNSLDDARKKYPELNVMTDSPCFTWAMYDGIHEESQRHIMRFETWEINEQLSR